MSFREFIGLGPSAAERKEADIARLEKTLDDYRERVENLTGSKGYRTADKRDIDVVDRADVPLIDETRAGIAKAKAELRALGVEVKDMPDDEGFKGYKLEDESDEKAA